MGSETKVQFKAHKMLPTRVGSIVGSEVGNEEKDVSPNQYWRRNYFPARPYFGRVPRWICNATATTTLRDGAPNSATFSSSQSRCAFVNRN